jgi:hypothetical protein
LAQVTELKCKARWGMHIVLSTVGVIEH